MAQPEAINLLVDVLTEKLPPVFSRRFVEEITGGLIKRYTLSNMDSKGEGPPSFKLGNKVGYEKQSFLEWITKRVN